MKITNQENLVPETMSAWQLYGAGIDNFGKEDSPCTIPVPKYGDDELLMKVEAIGLCFSDVKLIRAGEKHPRVVVDNLRKSPIIPGHEAVLKVVGIGKDLTADFKPGQRYIIQADIYLDGINLAYGYAINGGLAQYSVMTEAVLNGDAGCYLLPISEDLSAAEAALIEPWTCVIAAYRIPIRTGPKPGGTIYIIGDGTQTEHSISSLLNGGSVPARIITSDLKGRIREELDDYCAGKKMKIEKNAGYDDLVDDLIVIGKTSSDDLERLTRQLTRGGIFCLAGDYDDLDIELDIGGIHYKKWRYIGTPSNDIAEAYRTNTRNTLLSDGVAWFPGGAGAMGQMHVQLALEHDDGPRKLVITDVDDTRLNKLRKRLKTKADEKDIELVTYNPNTFSSEDALFEKLLEESNGGFDDIVMLVPEPAVLSKASRLLGKNGMMNIFAGIPAGKGGGINIGGIVSKGHRYIGSSGSSIDDMRYTLQMTEEGNLSPAYALAAIGGMKVAKKGIEALIEARFAGKTVIYPHAPDMPLLPVEDVESICRGASETLEHGEVLTKRTEEMIRSAWEKYPS